MGEIRRAHFARSDALIKLHTGYTIKTIGDSVMAVFRSVGAALDYAHGLYSDPGHKELQVLGIRAGIHVGSVDVKEDDIDGIEVAVAARVVHAIDGAEIWLSQQAIFDLKAHRPARHKDLLWRQHRSIELKGIGAQTLWSLAR
jgi:class 3 adenylate cyclase